MAAEMIVLGLGSNIGCRLTQLRRAANAIQQLPNISITAVSPVYQSQALLTDYAPQSWDQPFLNITLKCQTTLSPLTLLRQLKALEKKLGRHHDAPIWSPRLIDIDILAWAEKIYHHEELTIPHAHLLQRPFALNPLLDVAPDWRHPKFPQRRLTALTPDKDCDKAIRTHLRINKPHIVAIINVTPDSFSDGGQFYQAEQALAQCQQLLNDGAEIIDIGAESTRPGSVKITPEQEWQRLQPVLDAICSWLKQTTLLFKPKISLDSRHAVTFAKALENNYSIDWFNDVDGKDSAAISQLIQGSDIRYVTMHHLGIPPQRHCTVTGHVTNELYQFAEQRLAQLIHSGLKKEQIIFDVGIGYGKTSNQYRQLFHQLKKFQTLDVPLLVGHSRKSFINTINPTTPQQRDLETAILSALIAQNGIDYLRVHQVNFTQRTLNLVDWYHQEEYEHDDNHESI
ncbi:MAG: dihydropteroate synthase [Gammaproteobacteria bacterium]|nr:dihydropteroate synthase [Gammaproteobacteria bacterium]